MKTKEPYPVRNEPDPQRRPGSDGNGRFLFLGLSVGGPLDELRAMLEKKVRMYMNLKEAENAERLQQAYQIARAKLEAALALPRTPTGS